MIFMECKHVSTFTQKAIHFGPTSYVLSSRNFRDNVNNNTNNQLNSNTGNRNGTTETHITLHYNQSGPCQIGQDICWTLPDFQSQKR